MMFNLKPLLYRGTPPSNFIQQQKEKDPERRKKMGEKLDTVFTRRYFIYGLVLSLASFFAFMKGAMYIRMVYNAKYSVLNDYLWAPWFAIPAINTLLRALEEGTFMLDLDIADFFLNFMLEAKCQRLAGLELTHYIKKKEGAGGGTRHLAMCDRCLMGATFSPYQTGQGMGHAKDMILGDPKDTENVYHWAMLQLNLPGSELHDPERHGLQK
jgi:hypothetical protein